MLIQSYHQRSKKKGTIEESKTTIKRSLTERSHILEGLRDITEGELSKIAHNGSLRELKVLLLGGNSI